MDQAKRRLFDGYLKVKNVKLFPGTARDTAPDPLADVVQRVVAEIENDEIGLREFDAKD
jgi:hypothetical protein